MPEQTEIKVRIGEVATVHYTVVNEAARETTAQAALQRVAADHWRLFQQDPVLLLHRADLKPGETREMPVVFFVDPAIVKDPEQDDLNTITLSYTFYRLPEPGRAAGAGIRPTNSKL